MMRILSFNGRSTDTLKNAHTATSLTGKGGIVSVVHVHFESCCWERLK